MYCRLRKLTTLAFIVSEWLKTIEPNSTRFMAQELDRNQCVHGRQQKFFLGGNVTILLSHFRLLTMQCKQTFTKRFTLSTPLVCAGWTSILNLLSEMFSALQKCCFFHKLPNIPFFQQFLQLSHNLRIIINGQNNTSGENNKKVRHSRKTVSKNEK